VIRDEPNPPNFQPPTSNIQDEPAWIRDTEAGDITIGTADLSVLPQTMAAICEGEKWFCDICGHENALWPTRQWADHILTEHAGDLTIGSRTRLSSLCESALNPYQQNFFSMVFCCRLSMRRRAWKLGHAKLAGGKSLIQPAN
jgi:hypothetical protein